jgi:orotate phosphoribosyltransferase
MINYPDPAIAKKVASLLVEAETFYHFSDDGRQQPYVWTSGLISPCYTDHREIPMNVRARNQIVNYLTEMLSTYGLEFDYIAGTETAGICLGQLIADRLDKPFCFVRKKAKGYGKGKMVEGIKQGKHTVDRGLVFDEIFSTGGSGIHAAEALRREIGSEVKDVVGVTSNELPISVENFIDAGLRPHVLTNISYISKAAWEYGMSDEQIGDVTNFLSNPDGWAITQGYVADEEIESYKERVSEITRGKTPLPLGMDNQLLFVEDLRRLLS